MIVKPLKEAINRLSALSRAAASEDAFRRDLDHIQKWRWLADAASTYFSGEVLGWEHVPTAGPLMLVGNHSGGLLMPDAYVFASHWYRERFQQPLYVLGHDLLFIIPYFERWARSAGVLPGRMSYAEQALERKESVLVYPGGEQEVFRPITQRNQIQLQGHTGFIKLALRHRTPIVPLVGYGAQDVNLFLTKGEGLAKWLGLGRMRVKIMPLLIGPPWGLVPGFIPTIPLPTKITLEFQPRLEWPDLGPEAAEDPEVVQRCYDEVVEVMQQALTRLSHERPNPFSRRTRHPSFRHSPR